MAKTITHGYTMVTIKVASLMKIMHIQETILKTKSNSGKTFLLIKEIQITATLVVISFHPHRHSFIDMYCTKTLLDINLFARINIKCYKYLNIAFSVLRNLKLNILNFSRDRHYWVILFLFFYLEKNHPISYIRDIKKKKIPPGILSSKV